MKNIQDVILNFDKDWEIVFYTHKFRELLENRIETQYVV
jgi:hypothetical protein